MFTVNLDKKVHRVWIQKVDGKQETVLVQNIGPNGDFVAFTSFVVPFKESSHFKCVFLQVDSKKTLRVVGVLMDNLKVVDWSRHENPSTSRQINVGLEQKLLASISTLNVKTAGLLSCSFNDGERVRRPTSLDLARRYEYSEFYRPTVSMLGLCELNVPVPFWQQRWDSHERLLRQYDKHFFVNGKLDVAKLAYCVVGMFGWRTTYTSDKQDMLLQQLLVNYRGDCEDQALEQAKVIRSVLGLRDRDRWLRKNEAAQFYRRYVSDVYLVSGAANPCLEGKVIGHCWLAVKLKRGAPLKEFGLNGSEAEGRFAYMEGTTPVSWNWTSCGPGPELPPLLFNNTPLRVGRPGELQSLSYIFGARGRWRVTSTAKAPFEFAMTPDTAKQDEEFNTSFLRRLQLDNLNFKREFLVKTLKEDWKKHCKYLIQFNEANFTLQLPDRTKITTVKFTGVPTLGGKYLLLDHSDAVLGPFWTSTDDANAVQNKHADKQGSLAT